jgi:hypothetical protein
MAGGRRQVANDATITESGLEAPVESATDDDQPTRRAESDPSQPADDPEPPHRGGRWRWWVLAALVLGYLLQLAWRLWLARSAWTPIAHADEDRYLLSARVLAGGPGGLGNDTAAFRKMGYPLLLAPIYRATSNPFTAYHAAQAIGGAINALTFPLAYLFGRRVLQIERRWLALALAFTAATLPAVVYFSEFALTDAIFAPIGLGWLLLLHGWLAGRRPLTRLLAAMGSGAVVGYAYVVHVRGAIMLGIHLLVLLVAVVVQRKWWRVAAASALTAAVVVQLDWVTTHLVGNRLVAGGNEPQGRLWTRLTTAGGLVHTFCDAVGQIWYAGVATWGLAAIGLVVAVARIRDRDVNTVNRTQRIILAIALVTTVVIAISSAAALPNDGRVSNHAYFRYIAFLMPVWVVLAGSALYRAGRGRAFQLVGRAAALLAIGAFFVLSQMTEVTLERFQAFDTPETSFMTYSWDNLPAANATLVALILLVLLALTLAAPRSRRAAVLALTAVLAIDVAAMMVINYRLIQPIADAEYATGPELVRDLHIGPADVVVSSKFVSLGARLNHQREVYWDRVPEFDSRKGDPPADATVVIAPWHSRNHDDWDGTSLGYERIAGDRVNEWALWLRDTDPRASDGSITWVPKR